MDDAKHYPLKRKVNVSEGFFFNNLWKIQEEPAERKKTTVETILTS
jgi:hypothetical protein